MRRQDFHFDLPDTLIAQYPTPDRTASRLLCLDGHSGGVDDRRFIDLLDIVLPGDLLVFNNTQVIPARLFGHKMTGGKVEVLAERILDDHTLLAQIKASKSPKPGSTILLAGDIRLSVVERRDELFLLRSLNDSSIMKILTDHGHMPLPPYINRPDNADDQERYQTVYAEIPGAVAAPTAGLHFDRSFLNRLVDRGAQLAFVTLHVGAGTFAPVRVEAISEHKMHSEYIEVQQCVCERIKETKARGRRVIAVGTTSLRCLESASLSGVLKPFLGDTDIFIYPGIPIHTVDALITNFHLPESTLLMLVCAFAGYKNTMAAYHHAVEEGYRFFSYGDAMFIT